ncbi:MAG: hypothetical protein CVU02_01790 [Bacteroidetes bacterium HGW-Bacteroidetes-19]|nr:MAG: hypothetical protein CVU04_00340 [Bacteroidetes bacterium HGW-Bacteroidetes-20]PKP28158.1 MAG: hypothetical protein CVU02_01790 [Bacteroidetes bacterium HGW-Bacteroidetes-19]
MHIVNSQINLAEVADCVRVSSIRKLRFACIRAEPRKPAKLESDGMQGVKERPKEATLTTMQTTLYGCGLEGGDRPRA